MTTKYEETMPASLLDPHDEQGEIEVTFTWSPGSPETGPTYASGGEPATPDEYEIYKVVRIAEKAMVLPTADQEHAIIEWLDSHWEPPEPDYD